MLSHGAPIELQKRDARLGAILWLRNNADKRDPTAFARSGLQREALGHPVAVIDVLGWSKPYVWVCVVCNT